MSQSRETMKYVVVTGGVLSGLGKGISTSSIGVLLKSRGLKVSPVKIDPYLNVDAGTDGKDVGADIPSVERATCGAVNGTYCPSSNPDGGGLPFGTLAGIPAIIFLVVVAAVAMTLILLAWRHRRHE